MPKGSTTGTRVFEYLRAKGISNHWLAGQIGKSDSYMSAIKAGRLRINRAFIDGCVRALGVPESFLFFEVNERESSITELISSSGGDEPNGEGEAA